MGKQDDLAKLASLTLKKEYGFHEIQILFDLSKEIHKDRTKVSAFKSRYRRIENIRSEFLGTLDEIHLFNLKLDPDYTTDNSVIESFDTLFYAVCAAADELQTDTARSMQSPIYADPFSGTSMNKPIGQVRLGRLELVKFNGDIENWQTFYDTYVSLVHDNNNLTPIDKFHYLISCLSGDALSVVKGIPVTNDNYPVVFNTLVNRFQNKRLLATKYLDKICQYPQMKSCNLMELRNMTTLLYECVNALKAVKLDNLGEFILFYLVSRNLDFDTRRRFEFQNTEVIPTFDKLLKFLQDYVKILEASNLNAPTKPVPPPRLTNNNKPRHPVPQRVAYYSTVPSTEGYSELAPPCDTTPPQDCVPFVECHQISNSEPGPYSGTGLYSGANPYSDDSDFGLYADLTQSGATALDAGQYNINTGPDLGIEYTGVTGTYSAANVMNKFPDCACCGFSHHGIYKCPLFHSYNLAQRLKIVKDKKLCVNCLRPNHGVDKCISKSSCVKCHARHHTLLHSLTGAESKPSAPPCPPPAVTMNSTSTHAHVGHASSLVILGTCAVRVQGRFNNCTIRALIDSGAQDCFMTTACARRLGLPIRRCNIRVSGLGQNAVHQVRGLTSCTIQPRDVDNPTFTIDPIVMDTITNKMPAVELPSSVREACKHLMVADDRFDRPGDIDLLLGAEFFHNFYDGQRLVLGPGLPVALHSVFGWVITGKLDANCRPPTEVTSTLLSTLALDQVLKRFWEIEEPPSAAITNPEHEKCENLYKSLSKRNPDGRYVVPILLKDSDDLLGKSYDSSLNRLMRLEKRLSRDLELKENYVNFMREYSALGHMTPVEGGPTGAHLIPHHCVLRPQSTTTSLRVVFDCSAKTSNGIALNDIVYTGPKLQNDIVDIITKFRIPSVVFTTDISKMYRNMDLRVEDRKYQHILWRDSPNEPVTEYELNTVTYGVSSSPYLAIRTLHQLAEDHGEKWPQAANALRYDTFLDDITAGAPSVAEAVKLKDDLISLLECAKFELRKWCSNSSEFLAELPAEHCQAPKPFCEESQQHTLKILGIQWDPVQDLFTYSASEPSLKCTKRAILSDIARIYDPLGWLTPVVLVAKLLLQDLWRLKLNWDDTVPEEIQLRWYQFRLDLQHLSRVQIPRQMVNKEGDSCELLGFCDGSTKGYGCCIYLRSSSDQVVSSHLVLAKSRVAPLKVVTVNRLELLGAGLLSRLLKHLFQLLHLKLRISRITAFTDSSTVLAWLNTPPYKLKTFVSHRVAKINDEVRAEYWQHVSTHDNIADLCSRGSSCSQLVATPNWWQGPTWITSDPATWPVRKEPISFDSTPELKTAALVECPVETSVITHLLDEHSSLTRVQRVVAWCLRFTKNAKASTEQRLTGGLSTGELNSALYTIIKHEQTIGFPDHSPNTETAQPHFPSVRKLNPYTDGMGLLRVGGRLKNATLPATAKHPLLLPKRSRLSLLLVDHHHQLYLHCGPRMLQSLVLRKFWILGIRNLIRSRLSKCVTCFKVNPQPCQPLMGNLPSPRVQPSRCFANIGVDFAGPLTIKESRRRNAHTHKVYVCVFVCLAVKAIHLEIVSDLSTAAFIAALDRFVSRRGLCHQIISDCGTNFVGARRYLTEIQQFLQTNQNDLNASFTERGISWHLNPPTGSHFGGIFESGVRSMKTHLKRVVGLQVLTYEELTTVLNKIEAVLNSRPLCVLSNDPGEVDVLTPGHFLTGGPLVSVPEPDLCDTYVPPLERWQMLQKLTQTFWRVWQREYLHGLQQRGRWFRDQANLKIGDVVMIVEQNLPPLEWRYGQVTSIHPGEDGVVRVVTLKTAKGYLKRPVTKLCPLPLQD